MLGQAHAQTPRTPAASELQHRIEGLGQVGSVLYVAAHPDDENTRLLAYLANKRHLRTAYLSMTRGGGGQNLIGREQAALLGVIRTGELMAARRTDGAQQFFTRARDFGYSKTPKETLKNWGHAAALDDVVRVVRKFRPDMIITRFRPSGRNHGHHTASAMLAAEAFAEAADPKSYGHHTKDGLNPWKTQRLVHNQSHWRLRRQKNPDLSKFIYLDVGGFDPLLGRSYGEIAGLSRSMHKSQGFGAAQVHGPINEYFEPVAGSKPSKTDLFSGLDFTWARYSGTAAIQKAHRAAMAAFDPQNPAAVLPALGALHKALRSANLPKEGEHWRSIKLVDVEGLMVDASGVLLNATADVRRVAPGEKLALTLTALNRGVAKAVNLRPDAGSWRAALKFHTPVTRKIQWTVPTKTPLTTPHWLAEAPTASAYKISNTRLIGRPDDPATLSLAVVVTLGGVDLTLDLPIVKTWVDPVRGQLTRPVEVLPRVTVHADRPVVLAPQGKTQRLKVTLTNQNASKTREGEVRFDAGKGWRLTPNSHRFKLMGDATQTIELKLEPNAKAGESALRVSLKTAAGGAAKPAYEATSIDYEHLVPRTVLRPTTARLIPVMLKVPTDRRIAYVQGSGDAVDSALAAIGYTVDTLTPEALGSADLKRYHAVVFGVRAFNKHTSLYRQHKRLMAFVKDGGTVIAQYNTHNRIQRITGPVGPYPFGISRGRVTDETAAVVPSTKGKKHRLLTHPHVLGDADWAGWVQERGLYFAETWDSRYETPLSMKDPGEKPSQGSLLLAKHGKGVFIYTGLSLFRQLPAGVPGAFRLLVNMVEHAR